MRPTAPPLDSVFLVKTPENIAFQYGTAGPYRRLPAYLLDLLIRFGVTTIVFIAVLLIAVLFDVSLGGTGRSALPMQAAFLIVVFLMEWFFAGFCEAYFNGQTIGKYILGLRVVTTDGKPINGMQAVMRNILRSADIMPPFTIIGLIVMACNKRYQRLGDLVCGTMVVVEEKPWLAGVAKLDDPRAIQLAAHIPADFVVSRSLAKALSTYVERRRFFAAPRRKEMARHVAVPLLERFGIPVESTSWDLFLCALYYRTFIADRRDDEKHLAAAKQTAGPPGPSVAAATSSIIVAPPVGPPQLQGGGETFRAVTPRDHRS